jgi:type I restriction enzyme, S subunit
MADTLRLGEVAKVISGYAFKSSAFTNRGVPVVKIANIRIGNVDLQDCQYVAHDYIGAIDEKYRVLAGDVLISLTGSQISQPNSVVGRVARQSRSAPLCLLNQRVGKVIIKNPHICDKTFVYYALFRSETRKILASMGHGAASQANVSPSQVESLEIPNLPVEHQRRIAAVLSAYDDLTENNTRRIQILEEMARRIYEEWFVRFRFPGHENVRMVESELGLIPDDWKAQGLYDISELTYGFPFKSKLFKSNRGSIGIVRIRDIRTDKASAYTDEPCDQKYLLSDGDLLIGMDGEFHMGRWAGGKAALNQRVVMLRPKGNLSKYFLFLLIENPIKHLEATIVGTTVAHLSAKDLRSMKLITPNDDILKVVSPLFDCLFKQEIALKKKNEVLRRTRDLLLPKLISGEIDVSNFPEPE